MAKNKEQFGQPIEIEVFTNNKRGSSKYDKVIKTLKAILRGSRKYTDEDRNYIQSVINSFGNKIPSEAIAKKLQNFLESEFDEIKVLSGIRSIVPDTYLHTENQNNNQKNNKPKEIILSEFLCGRDE